MIGGKIDVKELKFTQFTPATFFETGVKDTFVCPDGNGETGFAPGPATNPPIFPEIDDITYAILPGQGTITLPTGTGTLTWGLTIPLSPPQTTTKS